MPLQLRGASVDPTSQVCSSAMLVLTIADKCKVRFYGSLRWHNAHTKSCQQFSSWVMRADNAEFLIVKVGGTYSYQRALNILKSFEF
jgi:hypothetical protein